MVFAVNPEPDGTYDSFAAFKAKVLAIAIGEQLAVSDDAKY